MRIQCPKLGTEIAITHQTGRLDLLCGPCGVWHLVDVDNRSVTYLRDLPTKGKTREESSRIAELDPLRPKDSGKVAGQGA